MAPKKTIAAAIDELMVVNDSPGEECRIAILQDRHLEELYTERTASATNVGNIYKGRVVNVEPAIQAAFIDYGEGINGFLHISDLHPKYFPTRGGNGSTPPLTERVGKKIPRRDRPPIQAALHRGDEILVQVLKEGIGTKGPTLTSYLSIPGRLLVLMPDMDRVGVSRKVEDEQKRREMREILDSLDLPDGFGFILRTAGFGKTKTELKRDAAYLMRLWKVMDKRIKNVGAPCELYTESDLLIRTVRDVLRPSIKAIVVDSPSAYERISGFLQVVTPRSAPRVIHYRRAAPIFHAFDIERQIELIHSGEVPLPSGGRLVIEQTEALVAIDVNSGRSRSARDSETNAYETNCEAADEICRQLRLRDLGGLIVNDLIDMRSMKHRKLIEERFAINLKRDRARATALAISDFGILEMTRQRMRPSLRKSHFMACSHCNGHGEIKNPDYVAADAVRHVGFLLQYERVHRVELVCSPRVASVLLSRKRRELVRMEESTGKRVDVRVSDTIAADRTDFYGYDERNADIDTTKLPQLQPPGLEEMEADQLLPVEEVEAVQEEGRGRKRRRRRGGGPADATAIAMAGGFDDDFDGEDEDELEARADVEEPAALAVASQDSGAPGVPVSGDGSEGPRRRRRRRRRRKGGEATQAATAPEPVRSSGDAARPDELANLPAGDVDAWAAPAPLVDQAEHAEAPGATAAPDGQPAKRKRRRSRGGRRRKRGERAQVQPITSAGALSESPATEHVSPLATDGNAAHGAGAGMRVHELARELSVSSRELIERCEPEPGIHHVANALAMVSADEAQAIRDIFASPDEAQPALHHVSAAPRGAGKSRRRRGGRKQGAVAGGGGGAVAVSSDSASAAQGTLVLSPSSGSSVSAAAETEKSQRSRRRRRGRRGSGGAVAAGTSTANAMLTQNADKTSSATQSSQSSQPQAGAPHSGNQTSAPPVKKRRALYRAGRGSVKPTAREGAGDDE